MKTKEEFKGLKNITLGDLKDLMLIYCEATSPSALRRVTNSVIGKYKAIKEAELIIKA